MQVYVTQREYDLLLGLARENRQDLSQFVRLLCRKRIYQSLRRIAEPPPPPDIF